MFKQNSLILVIIVTQGKGSVCANPGFCVFPFVKELIFVYCF